MSGEETKTEAPPTPAAPEAPTNPVRDAEYDKHVAAVKAEFDEIEKELVALGGSGNETVVRLSNTVARLVRLMRG